MKVRHESERTRGELKERIVRTYQKTSKRAFAIKTVISRVKHMWAASDQVLPLSFFVQPSLKSEQNVPSRGMRRILEQIASPFEGVAVLCDFKRRLDGTGAYGAGYTCKYRVFGHLARFIARREGRTCPTRKIAYRSGSGSHEQGRSHCHWILSDVTL